MTRDEMLAIDNAVRDAIGDGDLDAFDRLMAPDLAAEFREGLAELKRAFGDYSGVNENGQTGPVHGHRDEPVRGRADGRFRRRRRLALRARTDRRLPHHPRGRLSLFRRARG